MLAMIADKMLPEAYDVKRRRLSYYRQGVEAGVTRNTYLTEGQPDV